jgi:hypothetical protein
MTKTERKVIVAVVLFGGYVVRGAVQRFLGGVSRQRANVILGSLVQQGFLRVRWEQIQKQRVYQATARACALLPGISSFVRAWHSPPVFRCGVMRSTFLLENVPVESFVPTSRAADWLRERGVPDGLIPRPIADALIILPPFAPEGGVCVAHWDQYDDDEVKRLKRFVQRWTALIRAAVFSVRLVVVVENAARRRIYERVAARLKVDVRVFSIDRFVNFCWVSQ